MRLLRLILCALVLAWGSSAAAGDENNGDAKISPIIELGFYLGAEDLSSARFVSGTTENVEAGGLLDFNLGAVRSLSPHHELQATLGFRFDGVNGTRGNVSWSRWVVEGKYFYRLGRSRMGLGLSYHVNPNFEINLDAYPTTTINFDNALGAVAEWDYMSRQTYFGLKYTLIDYTADNFTIDGSSIGLVYGFNFR